MILPWVLALLEVHWHSVYILVLLTVVGLPVYLAGALSC